MNLIKDIANIIIKRQFTIELCAEYSKKDVVDYVKYNLKSAELYEVEEKENLLFVITGVCDRKDYKILQGIRDIKII